MTNEERRQALSRARARAFHWAEEAEIAATHDDGARNAQMATMWAAVAEAMKDGDPAHDGVTDTPERKPSLARSPRPTSKGWMI